ncbi:MAG: ABC transporter substrate-binding protein [Lachnospiraceae bacterium]|nr:ABC transporter substrate-binding protein [Lachnospiraceae bacterium]
MRRRNRQIQWIALLLSAVVSAAAITGCGSIHQNAVGLTESAAVNDSPAENTKTVVTIGYLPITHALTIFEEKELLEAEDAQLQIKLQKFGSWTDLTDALNAGQIDGASMLVELAMSASSRGIGLKAVALGHRDGNVVVVSRQIESAADLKGKTFAIPSNQSSHNILLNDLLTEAGLTREDLNIIQLSPAEMPSSLAGKAIDGYCVAEPFGAQAVVNGIGHVLYKSEELWENSICCALVLREDFIDSHGDDTTLLAEYYNRAGDALTDEEKLAVAEQYLGQDKKVMEKSLEWISFDNLAINTEDYERLTEKVKKDGILESPPAYEKFVWQKGGAQE